MIATVAEVLHEVALLVGAIGGLVFVIFTVWAVVRRPWRTMNAKFGKLEISLDQVNRAVNHVPAGTPTLVARVGSLEKGQAWERDALTLIADNVGVDLPSFPTSGEHS